MKSNVKKSVARPSALTATPEDMSYLSILSHCLYRRDCEIKQGIEGKILTLLEAAIPNEKSQEALKSLVRDAIWSKEETCAVTLAEILYHFFYEISSLPSEEEREEYMQNFSNNRYVYTEYVQDMKDILGRKRAKMHRDMVGETKESWEKKNK